MIDAIATHSFNMKDLKDLMDKFPKRQEPKEISCEIKVNPEFDIDRLYGIKCYESDYIQPEHWTGKWLVEGNEFFTYWDGDGQPPSWAIYCGFVKKEMKKTYYMFNMPRFLITSGGF